MFRFPNDRDEYMMSVAGYLDDPLEEIKSPFKFGKSRMVFVLYISILKYLLQPVQ